MSESGVERTVRIRNGKVPSSLLPQSPGVDASGEPDGRVLTTSGGEAVWDDPPALDWQAAIAIIQGGTP